MKNEYKDIFDLKTLLWELRYNEIKQLKSAPWEMSYLQKTLKGLKNNQSRDPSGIMNELLKPGVLGQDLAVGLLDLINGIKLNLYIPETIKLANITTIYKNKGCRQDLKNDRGIFILSVIRKILDKMMYGDKYDDIDMFMSDSNIGARKKKKPFICYIWDNIYGIISMG